jgi:diguanylate cyclase (GGDEF)-like protein
LITVLMGGFSNELRQKLQSRLGDVNVLRVERGQEVIEASPCGETSLLVLEHRLEDPPALDVLEQIRSSRRTRQMPIIYCLNEGSGAELIKRLAREFQVEEVMLPPLDLNELARQAARLLGLSLVDVPRDASEGLESAVAEVRNRFMDVLWNRVDVLEQAGTALLEGKLHLQLRTSAGREAHKLAGLLGTIGFAAGSRYAREIEELLTRGAVLNEAHALRLSELVVALRMDLEKGPSTVNTEPGSCSRQFSLMIVDNDRDLVERLGAEAAAREWRVECVSDFSAARLAVAADPPDVVLMDPHLSGDDSEGLALLEEMSARSPSIPVIVLTSRDAFTDRVEVARRGGRGFLSKSSATGKIAEAASQLVSRARAEEARIMAVDDDPLVLAFLRSLLVPRGIRFRAVEDPLQFWEELKAFVPDFLLLDVDMPCLSGVELCRVVRNDARWAATPILFLTQHDDPGTIDRAFRAGADDFVAKPIVGPELLTRVFNRLEQTRLRRSIAETDQLTGVFNRAKFSRVLADFLDLSSRQSQPLAFALIELDNLKEINCRHGYATGDTILQKIGGLLRDAFRSEDVLGRWNGCRFALGMYGLSRYDGVQRLNDVMKRIQKEWCNQHDGEELPVRVSAAVAAFDDDGVNLEALLQAAEGALLQAQKSGGGRVVPAGWVAGGREAIKRFDVALVMKDEAQASLLSYLLDARGCRTRWFRDGRSAARLMGGSKPALQPKAILIDVDLPGLDGLSVLRHMATDGVSARTIVLTSPSVADAAQIALELGAFDCVAKPFNPPVVIQHICRALDER